MIFKFRMISDGEKAFLRDYEIDSASTFFDFHNFIQKDLEYDAQQLASFFLSDESWSKVMEFTLIDMGNDSVFAAIPMEQVKICDFLSEKKDRLLYVFDIFADKALFIELIDRFDAKPGKVYPICSASIGIPPEQACLELNSEGLDLDELIMNADESDGIYGRIDEENGFDFSTEEYLDDTEDF